MKKLLSDAEMLLNECDDTGINVETAGLPDNIEAIYYCDENTGPVIAINEALRAQPEICCALAEELGHYYTSCGNLLTDSGVDNTTIRRQEVRAKRWAVKRLVSLKSIIKAYEAGCKSIYEFAEYLNVTENFFRTALRQYSEMYGLYRQRGSYVIYFDPPAVLKFFK